MMRVFGFFALAVEFPRFSEITGKNSPVFPGKLFCFENFETIFETIRDFQGAATMDDNISILTTNFVDSMLHSFFDRSLTSRSKGLPYHIIIHNKWDKKAIRLNM
jgi:hypothetical protein